MATSEAQEIKKQEALVSFISYKTRMRVLCSYFQSRRKKNFCKDFILLHIVLVPLYGAIHKLR